MKTVNFGQMNSYADFGLILNEANIPPALPKTNYVDVPCADGSVDLSACLGGVKWNNRECTFTFTVPPTQDWELTKMKVALALCAGKMNITLSTDDEWYYFGRCWVSEYQSDGKLRKLVVTANVEPFKFSSALTNLQFKANSTATKSAEDTLPVVPTFTTTASAVITQGDVRHEVGIGTHKFNDIRIGSGRLPIGCVSAQAVSMSFRRKVL